LAKKGDQFVLPKNKCKNFKAYIFGKNKIFFVKVVKNLMSYETFMNLKSLIKKIFLDIKKDKKKINQTILFSPAAASFDDFKNFEERGKYFNTLSKKFNNVK